MFFIILYLTKLTNWIINTFGLGAGYTWPGHLALKLDSKILSSKKIKFRKGLILISGTNGKTTTSKLVSHFITSCGFTVAHNKTGANLLNGLVSAILLDMDLSGNLRSDYGVFEIDEFTLSYVLSQLTPDVLGLLNLSRDQLDRYGEVDIIFDRWQDAVKKLSPQTKLVVDETQEHFKHLQKITTASITFFNADTNLLSKSKLHGTFNAKNINAAVAIADLISLDKVCVEESLQNFEVAYGRGELIKHGDKHFQLFLSKNPASFNHNLQMLSEEINSYDTLFFVLNDNIPDGRDVSWIYDVEADLLNTAGTHKQIYVSGTRALDMAIRLNYAGVTVLPENISHSNAAILEKILKNPQSQNILVVPNYSAMLELRKILTGRSIL